MNAVGLAPKAQPSPLPSIISIPPILPITDSPVFEKTFAVEPLVAKPPATKTPATPALNLHPVKEEYRDGVIYFRPAGSTNVAYWHAYVHGIGGIGNEREAYFQQIASGRESDPVMTVAPLAADIMPKRNLFLNAFALSPLVEFVMSQSKTVQGQLFEALSGRNDTCNNPSLQNVWKALKTLPSTLEAPPTWYQIHFKKVFAEIADTAWMQKLGIFRKHFLVPDHDATIAAIFDAAKIVTPALEIALERVGALPGRISASGFSQGGPLALHFADKQPKGAVRRTVIISSVYEETRTSQTIRNDDMNVDVIIPKDDFLPELMGLADLNLIRTHLRNAFSTNARLWSVDGRHKIEGAVAELASRLIREAFPPLFEGWAGGLAPAAVPH